MGILLNLTPTFLFYSIWKTAHTHTERGESGRWVCGSWSWNQEWKDLCVAVALIPEPFSSGILCVSSKESKFTETQRKWEREGKWGRTVFSLPFLLKTSFFSAFKAFPAVLECPSWFTFWQFYVKKKKRVKQHFTAACFFFVIHDEGILLLFFQMM